MALGIDNKLKSSMTPSLSPKAPSYPQIGDRTVSNANNNIMAGAAGNNRMAQQAMAGRGMSSGKGQDFRANVAQDDATIKAAVGAAKNTMDASSANNAARQQAEHMRKMEDLSTKGILNGLASSQAMNSLAMQGMAQSAQNFNNQAVMNRWTNKFDAQPQILQYLLS
jgi:hypothetical protein